MNGRNHARRRRAYQAPQRDPLKQAAAPADVEMVFDYLGALSVPAIMEGKLDLDIGAALMMLRVERPNMHYQKRIATVRRASLLLEFLLIHEHGRKYKPLFLSGQMQKLHVAAATAEIAGVARSDGVVIESFRDDEVQAILQQEISDAAP